MIRDAVFCRLFTRLLLTISVIIVRHSEFVVHNRRRRCRDPLSHEVVVGVGPLVGFDSQGTGWGAHISPVRVVTRMCGTVHGFVERRVHYGLWNRKENRIWLFFGRITHLFLRILSWSPEPQYPCREGWKHTTTSCNNKYRHHADIMPTFLAGWRTTYFRGDVLHIKEETYDV